MKCKQCNDGSTLAQKYSSVFKKTAVNSERVTHESYIKLISWVALYVASCTTCLEFRNQQQKEKLIPHDIPSEVWSKVGTDLFYLRNKDYLIIADYNTKFFEISELPNTLAQQLFPTPKTFLLDLGFQSQLSATTGLSLRLKNTNCSLSNGTSYIIHQAPNILEGSKQWFHRKNNTNR